MKTFQFISISICAFFFLVLCAPYVVPSNHGAITTTTPHQPLKFYMQPWHRDTSIFGSELYDLRAHGIPNEDSVVLLVNISFGYPPIPQLLIMDTGSDLTWVQCASCTTCFRHTIPLFDPSMSKTYDNLSCSSPFCKFPLRCSGFSNLCTYIIQYFGDSMTKGMVGSDQLTFKTSDNRDFTVGHVVFGCGTENNLLPKDKDFGSGILGLGAGPLSLTSQKGRQFSYCIGNLDNRSYAYNQLIIGDGAIFRGFRTLFEVYDGHYYLTMEGISVGDKRLNIDPSVFRKPPIGGGGMIIDTGTTLSSFPRVAFDALKAEVISLIGNSLERRYSIDGHTNNDILCYSTWRNPTANFPIVTFHFADIANMQIQPSSFFTKVNFFTICMAVEPAKAGRNGVIGLLAQQNYNIGYDLMNEVLYFDNVDCEKI